MSFTRKLADLINADGVIKDSNIPSSVVGKDSAYISDIISNAGVTLEQYTIRDSLPSSGLTSGDKAYVTDSNRFYISNGSGWYNVALLNNAPYWDSAPSSAYTIQDSQTPLIVTALALDSDTPEGLIMDQSFASDSAQYLVDITVDSSVFTFTPKTQDSISSSVTAGDLTDSYNNDFNYTFKFSDGVNFVAKLATITYNFAEPIVNTFISATGGAVTTIGDYKYHAFTSTGNSNFVVSSVGTGTGEAIEYLIVAGGGGGGYASNLSGGGGGGGGVIHHSGWTGLSAQTYTITVGSGGSARNNGGNSSAFGNTALGGGKGGSDFSNGWQGGDGGSGGGSGVHSGGQDPGSALSQTTIAGATAYGNAGGNNERSSPYYAGGGGGASSVGGAGTTTVAGNGGAGYLFGNFNSWGTNSSNTTTGSRGYFGGGGGAGAATLYGGTDTGTGGVGGGANGGTGGTGVSAIANTGGGGGGGNTSGGSGIVIIRYRYQ